MSNWIRLIDVVDGIPFFIVIYQKKINNLKYSSRISVTDNIIELSEFHQNNFLDFSWLVITSTTGKLTKFTDFFDRLDSDKEFHHFDEKKSLPNSISIAFKHIPIWERTAIYSPYGYFAVSTQQIHSIYWVETVINQWMPIPCNACVCECAEESKNTKCADLTA